MGFLDNLRDRLRPQQDYYEDDVYDDYYDDGQGRVGDVQPRASRRPAQDTSGILGNTRRPEAESVVVTSRHPRPQADAGAAYVPQSYAPKDSYSTREYDYAPRTTDYDAGQTTQMAPTSLNHRSTGTSILGNTTGGNTPADIGLTPKPRSGSGKLPPYVLKPVSYEDVQMVVRRVRTNQPVVLSFKSTNIEIAKRILDFSYGLSFGVGGRVDELGDRVFVVLPQGIELSDQDIQKLQQDGTLESR